MLGEGRSWRWGVCALVAVALAGCGDGARDAGCGGGDGEGPFVPREGDVCERLSTYGMLSLDGEGRVVPRPGVLPFAPITELFSNYAIKTRTVYVPPGASIQYGEGGALDFPTGTVLTKTFAFADDLRTPDAALRVIETRVLLRREDGWAAFPYVWDEDHHEAILRPEGGWFDVEWTHLDGSRRSARYEVPNRSQCAQCHGQWSDASGSRELLTLGATALHLDAELDYGRYLPGEPPRNQLERWHQAGFLTGAAPEPPALPALPPADDPAAASLHLRARAYLHVNCAHCHNRRGSAATSSLLRLHWEEQDPWAYGVCLGTEVVPGNPERSAVVRRMSTNDPNRAMPRIGRTVVHDEGVALVSEWIDWLATPEAIDHLALDDPRFNCF
jgi:uncharacterized repeat protein (TIGR03806 family)